MAPLNEKTTLSLTMRPKTFDDVIGLESAILSVRTKLDKEEVPRAFLIEGLYGCGKTTLANIIARYIQGPLFEGTPQITEVNGANYRKIDDMRELANAAGSLPLIGTYAVIIIDECQQLTKEAQQVLLKELEVPKSPTVWILATTDPHKINEGVRDRCFHVAVGGMNEAERHELIVRAAKTIGTVDDDAVKEFEAAAAKGGLASPRKILQAFEVFSTGVPAKQAVGMMHYEMSPDFFDIAQGIVFGQWEKGYTIPWLNKSYGSVSEQFKKLDEKLKKKPAKPTGAPEPTGDEADSTVEDDDLISSNKAQTAQGISIIVSTLLKNQVIRGGVKGQRAAAALFIIAHMLGSNAYGMEWALTVGGMYRVHQTLIGAGK